MKLKPLLWALGVVACTFAAACTGGNSQDKPKEHLLSGQQKALERAKDVNNQLLEAEKRKRQQVEDSFR